jgi:hypothetical protein
VLVFGHSYDNLLRLGVGVLGGDDLGVGGAVISVLLPRQLLSLGPGPAQFVGDDGADVEDLSIFSNELFATTS